ncbi:MAG: hypothetical protein KF819_32950 [Labilithrix sp.]|nr:hypothetical protein [Labilithrix sp.]
MMRAPPIVFGLVLAASCSTRPPAPTAARDASGEAPASAAPKSAGPIASADDAGAAAPMSDLPSRPGRYDVSVPSPSSELAEFLRARVPKGGSVSDDPPRVFHTVQSGETLQTIVAAYQPLSDLYTRAELQDAIVRKNASVTPGKKIEIPRITTRVIRDDPRDERLGWPEDRALRGVFVTGSYAGIKWVDTLDKLAERGLNAVVLDGKDYEGYVNYPSKAKVAVETKAMQKIFVPDLARAIRFAHWRGVRVIIRIPCFHDPWADKHAKDARMSIRFAQTNKPIHVDWLDPTNTEAQDYVIELAKEGIEAGADEIQLDYVRFPVHLSQKVAVLPQQRGSVEDHPRVRQARARRHVGVGRRALARLLRRRRDRRDERHRVPRAAHPDGRARGRRDQPHELPVALQQGLDGLQGAGRAPGGDRHRQRSRAQAARAHRRVHDLAHVAPGVPAPREQLRTGVRRRAGEDRGELRRRRLADVEPLV